MLITYDFMVQFTFFGFDVVLGWRTINNCLTGNQFAPGVGN